MTDRRQSLHLFSFYLPFLRKYKELLTHKGGGSRHGPKIHFSFPVISRSFFIKNTMEENQKMGPWAFVEGLIDNDEKAASAKKHAQLKTRAPKPHPIYNQNGQNRHPIHDPNG